MGVLVLAVAPCLGADGAVEPIASQTSELWTVAAGAHVDTPPAPPATLPVGGWKLLSPESGVGGGECMR